jgi:outer membrane protein assembly factor BamB
VGNSVIVTAEPDVVVCVDITTGKELWKTSTPVTELSKEQQGIVLPRPGEGGNMAGTPACDGERVYAVFAVGFAAAFDLKTGKRLWAQAVQAPLPGDGRSGSPVCVADLVIVHLADLVAFDAKSGQIRWKQSDAQEGYGTPVAGKIGNDDVLFTPKGSVIRVSDGKILASLDASLRFCSPCLADKKLFYIDSEFYIFDLPEKLTDPLKLAIYWNASIDGEIYSTPLCYNGFVYTLTKSGLLTVLDVKNKTKTDKQLELEDICYPSPVLAGKFIFVGNDKGKTIVLEAGKDAKIVNTNELDGGSGGTPAFAGKKMFIKSGDELVCIGEK